MGPFEELLAELGNALGVSLNADSNNSCTLLVDEKLKVQLEMQKEKDRLLMGARVGVVDPGRFRENVLIEALKENNLPYPQVGIFGYSPKNNQLALYDTLDLDDLTGEKLANYLSLFIGKSLEWKNALESGHSAPQTSQTGEGPKPFDLR